MTSFTPLGQLSAIQELVWQLVESVTDTDYRCHFHPELSPLGWYLGRCVFIESWWLRKVVLGEATFSDTVSNLFTPGKTLPWEQGERLPPKHEMLTWARRIQEDDLMRLANPKTLPEHPLLEHDYLQNFILQEYCRQYEAMVGVLNERALQRSGPPYIVKTPLRPLLPQAEAREVPLGHYRIGGTDTPMAYDNELPPQAVELSAFRVATRPVSNSQYLAFMEAGGYRHRHSWTDEGWHWRTHGDIGAPHHWRQDAHGHWYGVGINGAYELAPNSPVAGINGFEAKAFAHWAASLSDALAGAILPHEYQWEVARRLDYLRDSGLAWEWCANPFHPYTGFQAFPAEEFSAAFFDAGYYTLRGASLHTRPPLRRPSFRNFALPHSRHLFAGLRLILPPR
jgi:iron(II)-dependent oxidoreductase